MIFIDGDILVYRIGFGRKGYEFVDQIEPLQDMVGEITSHFANHEPVLVLSNPSKTFRHSVAVTQPYKGNRTQEKPEFYEELRAFMLDEMGAVMSEEGYEADDYIGMNVDRRKDIICTLDKDLYMIPARGHYNFVKKELVKIRRPAYYFWSQMMIGDQADNIRGLKGIGPKTAELLLDGVKTSKMRKVVEGAYEAEFGEKWFDRFDENGRLLWIKRHKDKEYFHYV